MSRISSNHSTILFSKSTEVHKYFTRRVLAILFWLWFAVVHIASFIPRISITHISIYSFQFRGDYVLHCLTYLTGSLLFCFWRRKAKNNFQIREILLYAMLGVAISSISEVIQKFIPGRVFNIYDFYFNALGIIIGFGLFFLLAGRKNSKTTH